MNEYDELQQAARNLASGANLQEGAQSSKYDGMAVSDRYFANCLFEIAGHGFAEDEAGSVDDGEWLAQIKRWVIAEDSQGFRDIREFASAEDAAAFLDRERRI